MNILTTNIELNHNRGQEIKLILHHIPYALPAMIAKASYENVSIYAARVRLTRTQTGNNQLKV